MPPPPVVTLTIAQKIDVINAFENKQATVKELQLKYKCGKSQIYKLIKDRHDFKEKWQKSVLSDNAKRKSRYNGKHDKLNELVHKWLTQVRSKNIPVTGPMMKAAALKIAAELSIDSFSASNGWLECFRKRHNIKWSQINGEASDVNPVLVNNWPAKLASLISRYELCDIANADETALFFRAIPNKTLAFKGDR